MSGYGISRPLGSGVSYLYSLFHIAGNSEHPQGRMSDVEVPRVFRIPRKLAPDGLRVVPFGRFRFPLLRAPVFAKYLAFPPNCEIGEIFRYA